MNSHQPCRFCNGTNFFSAKVQAGGSAGSLLPVGALHGPSFENVICGTCGHTEWFVAKENLPLVKNVLPAAGGPSNA